jgi:hypothetical protein
MSLVERQYGKIEDGVVSGDTVFTVTVYGQSHPVTEDLMDRVLQHTLMELDVDTSWQEVPPPPIDPGPVDPQLPDGYVTPPTVIDEQHPPLEGPDGPVPGVNIVA